LNSTQVAAELNTSTTLRLDVSRKTQLTLILLQKNSVTDASLNRHVSGSYSKCTSYWRCWLNV